MPESTEHIEAYFKSIVEREVIFIRKELLNLPRSEWTDIDVYKEYRFCNVHRCYDKTFVLLDKLSNKWGGLHPGLRTVLRWTANNTLIEFLSTQAEKDDEWRRLFLLANEAPTPEEADPVPLFKALLNAVAQGTFNLTTGSFIVKRYGNDLAQLTAYYNAGTRFYKQFVLPYALNGTTTTSQSAVQFFKTNAPYCADFTAYCIVSDWIYLQPALFTDLYTWTAYGSGAYNGINLLTGGTSKIQYLPHLRILREEWERRAPAMYDDILKQTGLTRDELNKLTTARNYFQLEDLFLRPMMLDVEHWLCEYAKYARGYAKRRYDTF